MCTCTYIFSIDYWPKGPGNLIVKEPHTTAHAVITLEGVRWGPKIIQNNKELKRNAKNMHFSCQRSMDSLLLNTQRRGQRIPGESNIQGDARKTPKAPIYTPLKRIVYQKEKGARTALLHESQKRTSPEGNKNFQHSCLKQLNSRTRHLRWDSGLKPICCPRKRYSSSGGSSQFSCE